MTTSEAPEERIMERLLRERIDAALAPAVEELKRAATYLAEAGAKIQVLTINASRKKKVRRSALVYAALVADLKTRNPNATFQQAADEIGCAPSTLTRQYHKNPLFRTSWHAADKINERPVEKSCHRRGNLMKGAHIAEQGDDDGWDEG